MTRVHKSIEVEVPIRIAYGQCGIDSAMWALELA